MTDEPRESATFAITVADYRRAFALAVAAWPDPAPSFGARLRERLAMGWIARAVFVASFAALAVSLMMPIHSQFAWMIYRILWFFGLTGAGTAVGTLALAMIGAWDARGARDRFPRQQAAWKRPQRLLIRWDDAGLTLAGQEGFGSFGWRMLYSWIDAPDELVIFTAMLDPVPVPHAALGPGNLDDLRYRLAKAEVPQGWRVMSDVDRGLSRVFR